jgi:2-iminobutanoate/2-iminopropanoate deaminase
MLSNKHVIGAPIFIGDRKLSLSKAIRAGDFIFLTGQIPFKDGLPMTDGLIEEQTEVVIKEIQKTLKESNCDLTHVVKAMVWLRDRADFPGFNEIYGKYFSVDPPARSAVISELLVDVRVEVEVIAYVGS